MLRSPTMSGNPVNSFRKPVLGKYLSGTEMCIVVPEGTAKPDYALLSTPSNSLDITALYKTQFLYDGVDESIHRDFIELKQNTLQRETYPGGGIIRAVEQPKCSDPKFFHRKHLLNFVVSIFKSLSLRHLCSDLDICFSNSNQRCICALKAYYLAIGLHAPSFYMVDDRNIAIWMKCTFRNVGDAPEMRDEFLGRIEDLPTSFWRLPRSGNVEAFYFQLPSNEFFARIRMWQIHSALSKTKYRNVEGLLLDMPKYKSNPFTPIERK